jgi:hypothetical protein
MRGSGDRHFEDVRVFASSKCQKGPPPAGSGLSLKKKIRYLLKKHSLTHSTPLQQARPLSTPRRNLNNKCASTGHPQAHPHLPSAQSPSPKTFGLIRDC